MYTASENLYLKNNKVVSGRNQNGTLKDEDERGALLIVCGASISDEAAREYGLIEADRSLKATLPATEKTPSGKAAKSVVETRATIADTDVPAT